MALRRSRATKKRRAKRRRGGARVTMRRAAVAVVVLFIAVAAAALAWFNHDLIQRFHDRHLAAPLHVYSRPLEWFPGTTVDKARAVASLRGIGYREVSGNPGPGGFSIGASHIDIVTRPFEYSDERHPSRTARVTFDGGFIRAITGADGGNMPVLLLDPVVIGSLASSEHEDRKILRLHQVPDRFLQVLLTVEDRNFMSHFGVDPLAIVRAMISNLRSGRITQGGSTISQQLVKNLYLDPARTISRKIREAIYAVLLEWHFDKHQILEAYINEVFLAQAGNRAIHGFALASEYFFGRPLAQLELQDYALLVGMVKAPSAYNPRRNPERARERRDVVLQVLAEEGLIDEATRAELALRPLGVTDVERASGQSYAGFLDLVRRQVARQGVEDTSMIRELRVWSTMDPAIQHAAEGALARGLARIEGERGMADGTLQGAVVVLRAENGQVVALAGDRRPGYDGFNRALEARRPVGSLLKPVIALTALESGGGYHLASPVADVPFSMTLKTGATWAPSNYDNEFHGVVPMLVAISESYNVASARLGVDVGVDPFVRRLAGLGLDSPPPAYPSALLGAVEMSPLEVARLYLPFASGGLGFPPRAYVTATDGKRRVLSRNPSSTSRLVDTDMHFLVHFALRTVVDRGTASRVLGDFGKALRLAGKTGTTDDFRDSWFAGYSGNYIAVVWVGRDDNEPTGLSGSSGALPIWRDLMRELPLRPSVFDRPANVQWHNVDLLSGYRVDSGCVTAMEVPFIAEGTLPPRGRCGSTRAVDTTTPVRSALTRLLDRLFSPDAPTEPAQPSRPPDWNQSGRR